MIAKTFTTFELDEPAVGAQDLADAVRAGLERKKNTIGILLCYSDIEIAEFVRELSNRLDFEFAGCCCIASMDEGEGFHEMAATLLVLSSDDCEFALAQSDAIDPQNVYEQSRLTYERAAEKLTRAPVTAFVVPPYELAIMLDEYVDAFNAFARGLPIFGGLPSYNHSGDNNVTIYNGTVSAEKMVLIAMSGAIRPVFSVQTVSGTSVDLKRKVTKAEGNVVYRVGSQTFVDYMREIDFPIDVATSDNATVAFVANPLLLENVKLEGGEDFSFVRTLHEIDTDEGTGTAIGKIPEGATLSICSMNREDIEQAATRATKELREKIQANEADGYRYSAIIAISCIGRYIQMMPKNSSEADLLLKGLPEGLSFAGFYGYGEIGPLPLSLKASINFAHNESIVLCAI